MHRIFIIIAWGLSDVLSAIAVPPVVTAIAALGLISGLGVATSRYLPCWQNGVKLFTRAALVANHPDYTIEEALGDAFASAGRAKEAYKHYGAACTLVPRYPLCHYNMSEILFNRHQLRDALEQLDIVLSLTDNKDLTVSSLINSGKILLVLGDYHTAQTRVAAALQIDPSNDTALILQRQANQQSVDH